MAVKTLVGYHTNLKNFGATWSAPAGTIDSAFPLTNQNTPYAHQITKFSGTSGTLRGTIASTAIQGLALINCSQKLAGLTGTVTNGGAMASQNIVVPAAPADGVSLNAFVDLRGVTAAGTAWDVAFSGVAAGGFGFKVLLIAVLTELPVKWNLPVTEHKPTRIFETEYDIKLGSRKAVRYRSWEPDFTRETNRAAFTTLRRSSEGPTQPFFFLLDYTASPTDPALCFFPEDRWTHQLIALPHTEWSDRLEEANAGLTH